MAEMITPYFMTNDKWYYFVDDGIKFKDGDVYHYKLTSEGKKIKKVVDSYNQYIKELEELKKIDAI